MVFFKGQLNHPSKGLVNKRKAKKLREQRKRAPFSPGRKQGLLFATKTMDIPKSAAAASVSRSTAYDWIRNPNSEQVAAFSGRPKKVSSEHYPVIRAIAKKYPFSRITEIIDLFKLRSGIEVCPRTTQAILYERLTPPFTLRKADYTNEETNLQRIYDMHLGYSDGLEHALRTGFVREDEVYYQDEFSVYLKRMPSHARCEKGKAFFSRIPYRYICLTVSVVMGINGIVKAELYKGAMNDSKFKDFCLGSQPVQSKCKFLGGKPLFDLLPSGSYIVWDRLGRSGRSQNPTAIHFNPVVRDTLRDHDIVVVLLPPKGHLLNPQELLNGCLQERISRWTSKRPRKDEYGRIQTAPTTICEARQALSDAIASTVGSTMFQGFYTKRMLKGDLQKRMNGSKDGQAVLQEREEVAVINHWWGNEE